jgi:hypothetical protein
MDLRALPREQRCLYCARVQVLQDLAAREALNAMKVTHRRKQDLTTDIHQHLKAPANLADDTHYVSPPPAMRLIHTEPTATL